MSIEIRQLEINLKIANERYSHLFVKQQENNMEIHLIQQVIDLVVACLLVIQTKSANDILHKTNSACHMRK
jgi:hypothetical protein